MMFTISATLVQSAFGSQAKPGTTLEALLSSHFAAHIIQDAVCTWCSLKWTLLEHHRTTQRLDAGSIHAEIAQKDGQTTQHSPHSGNILMHNAHTDQHQPASHTDSLTQHCQTSKPPSKQCSSDTAPQPLSSSAVSAGSGDMHLLEECMHGSAGHQAASQADSLPQQHREPQPPQEESGCDSASQEQDQASKSATIRDLQLLEGCLQSSAPLPEAELESMACEAGMRWVQRRGMLLCRTLIAQPPQVCFILIASAHAITLKSLPLYPPPTM